MGHNSLHNLSTTCSVEPWLGEAACLAAAKCQLGNGGIWRTLGGFSFPKIHPYISGFRNLILQTQRPNKTFLLQPP